MEERRLICRGQWRWLIVLLCLWFAPIHKSTAQRERVKHQPYSDLKTYYLGFNVGLHTQDLRISNSGFVTPEGQALFADVPHYRPGFSVGVMAGRVLIPGLELRLNPSLHFGDKPIAYSDGVKKVAEFGQRATYISLPLMLKYAALRLNNVRPYVGAGVYTALSLGGKREDVVRLRALDYGLSLSLGCDYYLRYFKLSPELSFSYGLTNVIQTNRPELAEDKRLYYTQAIRSGQNRMIALTFYFQ